MDEMTVQSTLAPEPEIPPQPKIWGAWATIGLGLATGLLFLGAQTLVLIGFLVAKIAAGPIPDLMEYVQGLSSNGLVVSLSSIASAIAGWGLIVLFVRIRGNKSVSEYIGLKRISWKTVLALVGVFILTFAAIVGLETLYNTLAGVSSSDSVNSNFMIDTYNTAGWTPLLWVAVVLFAPFFEEAFFRGFLFAGLARSRIGAAGAILITSLVWAAMHLQYDIIGMATIVILGIVLGGGAVQDEISVEHYHHARAMEFYRPAVDGSFARKLKTSLQFPRVSLVKASQLLFQLGVRRLNQHRTIREYDGRNAAVAMIDLLYIDARRCVVRYVYPVKLDGVSGQHALGANAIGAPCGSIDFNADIRHIFASRRFQNFFLYYNALYITVMIQVTT